MRPAGDPSEDLRRAVAELVEAVKLLVDSVEAQSGTPLPDGNRIEAHLERAKALLRR